MDSLVSNVGHLDRSRGLEAILACNEVSPDLLARAGSQMGMEAGELATNVASVRRAFEVEAQEAVGEPVLAWARANKLDALRAAARDHVTTGSTKGYADISKAYMLSLPESDPGMLLASKAAQALGVQIDRKGAISIELPKVGRVEWRSAIKAGLIAPHFLKGK